MPDQKSTTKPFKEEEISLKEWFMDMELEC